MEILLILCGYIAGILILFFYEEVYSSIKFNKIKNTEEINKQYNKVRFYVTANENEYPIYQLWLGKPYRNTYLKEWLPGKEICVLLTHTREEFESFGLNVSDYLTRTFKDEPIEVQLNLE